MRVEFEWDASKAEANARKHRVTFHEASTVFDDPLAAIFVDEDHSSEEEREIIIGHSILNRLVLVSFAERNKDTIRIISARVATKRERTDYQSHVKTKR